MLGLGVRVKREVMEGGGGVLGLGVRVKCYKFGGITRRKKHSTYAFKAPFGAKCIHECKIQLQNLIRNNLQNKRGGKGVKISLFLC